MNYNQVKFSSCLTKSVARILFQIYLVIMFRQDEAKRRTNSKSYIKDKTFPGTVARAARSTLGVGHFFTRQKENIKAAGKGCGGRFF